jgi:CheY-like chemotaxis protein
VACWERGVADCPDGMKDRLRFAHATALRNAGRFREAWEACAGLLRDTENYLPPAVELLHRLTIKLGQHSRMDAILAELDARKPVPRNAILLHMLVSSSGQNARKAKAAMAALLKHPAGLDELRLIFEMSARTHLEIERGILLTRLLHHLKASSKHTERGDEALQLLAARIFVTLADPVQAMQALNQIRTQPPSVLARMTGWMAMRMLDKHPPGYSAPKIFVIGLSKTGTTSLHEAMRVLGISSAHWTNPVTASLLDKRDFLIFDALSDVSVSYQFEHLFYAFPNARFIYTERPLDAWEKSFLRHYQRMGFGESFADMQAHAGEDGRTSYGLETGAINRTLYFNAKSPADAYHAFDRRVRDFFADKSDRLLTMNIFAGDGWAKLCDFLDRPVPDCPFPHRNSTAY